MTAALRRAARASAQVLVSVTSPGGSEPFNFFGVGLLVSMADSANLLPFLVLSAVKELFRIRPKALFHLALQSPPNLRQRAKG